MNLSHPKAAVTVELELDPATEVEAIDVTDGAGPSTLTITTGQITVVLLTASDETTPADVAMADLLLDAVRVYRDLLAASAGVGETREAGDR